MPAGFSQPDSVAVSVIGEPATTVPPAVVVSVGAAGVTVMVWVACGAGV